MRSRSLDRYTKNKQLAYITHTVTHTGSEKENRKHRTRTLKGVNKDKKKTPTTYMNNNVTRNQDRLQRRNNKKQTNMHDKDVSVQEKWVE